MPEHLGEHFLHAELQCDLYMKQTKYFFCQCKYEFGSNKLQKIRMQIRNGKWVEGDILQFILLV